MSLGEAMRRREFIKVVVGSAGAWPLAARAQERAVPLIGALLSTGGDDPESNTRFDAFVQQLNELGWIDGRNVRIHSRWAGGDPERARIYAAELVRQKPDVILASTS